MKVPNRLPFIICLVLFVGAQVRAQSGTGTVAGRVLLDTGEPAVGAVVLLEGTKMGSSANEAGAFAITNVPPGEYRVVARLVGYEQAETPAITVKGDEVVRIQLALRQAAIQLNQVVVTGNRRQAAEDTRPSVTSISPRESKFLPGAAEDVLRSLQAFPGVTSVNDFSSQLVVRGSGPDQNLIMIDGFEALNPYRLYGFVSMFNPETVSDISLQTGGFAARYGDRLSAVLDVKNREGRSDVPFAGKINASLTNVNLIFEGGLPFNGSSYLFSVRRTYYDLILGPVLKSLKLVQGDVALPNFRDLQGTITIPIDERNKVLLTGVTSRDGVELISGAERDRPDSVNVFDKSFNTLLGATWQFNPRKNVIGQTKVSWYRNKGTGSFDGSFVDPSQNTGDLGRADTLGIRLISFGVNYDYIYQKTGWSQQLLFEAGEQTLEAGYGVDFLRTDFIRYFQLDDVFKLFLESRGLAVPTDATESISYNKYNVFVQDRIRIADGLFVQPGVRLDFFPNLEKSIYAAPRLNVSLKIDDFSTVRAAFGIYYQSPGMEKQDFRNRITFTAGSFGTLVAERADHYILGYDRMVTPEWQFKIETYYKRFADAIVPQKLQGSSWYTERTGGEITSRDGWSHPVRIASDSLTPYPVNDSKGYSAGVEIMLQKIQSLPSDLFVGWVSYALSYAERDRNGLRTPFLFDQRHAVNVVGNYKFAERWDIGVKWTLRSGRPFSEALGVKPRVVLQRVGGVDIPVVQVDTRGRVVLDVEYERETFSGRLNLYHSLDLRVTTYPRWWSLNWSFYLDVQNIYNRGNEQAVTYFIDRSGMLGKRSIFGIPIFPSIGMSLTF
jgi:hypothetical protein